MLSSQKAWDESIVITILRGATHIQRSDPPFDLLLREGNRTRLRVRSTGVFPVLLAVSASSQWRFSLSGGVGATHPASSRYIY